MKIIKRDGRIVDYKADKIKKAIQKANNEVQDEDKISNNEIDEIINFIESKGKKRMLVEDIQDIIEEKLMQKGKYVLAKKYIIYRYTRSIIRKSNTTDASILSLLKNNDYNDAHLTNKQQRELVTREINRDLSCRLLLPKNVVKDIDNNYITICNLDRFLEPILYDTYINVEEMLNNGTILNNVFIDSPKSFQSACNILVEIITNLSESQNGIMYIELSSLFKYYFTSYDKYYKKYKSLIDYLDESEIVALSKNECKNEIKDGIQTIIYQINTITSLISSAKVCFIIDTDEIKNDSDELIIHEFIRQKNLGIKDMMGNFTMSKYPLVLYKISENNMNNKTYSYITEDILNSNSNYQLVHSEYYDKLLKIIKTNTQGKIILNISKIALFTGNENDFLNELDDTLNHIYEAFLCINHNLMGSLTNISPTHYIYGALARLKSNEKIDTFLKTNCQNFILSICGLSAAMKILKIDEITKNFIIDKINDTINKWNNESSFNVIISNYDNEEYFCNLYNENKALYLKNQIYSLYDKYDSNEKIFKSSLLYFYVDTYSEELLSKYIYIINSTQKNDI